jgi:eukaryotic-like serine/threonine-protein kinase
MTDLPDPTAVRSQAAVSTPGPVGPTVDLERTAAYVTTGAGRGPTRSHTIPGYELVRELGRGAFGVVYLAHRVARPDTPLAIKVVEDPGGLDRLLVEPTLLARVRHPNVVRLEDYFVHNGALVLVMEFVPGADLKARLDGGGPFAPDQVRDFLVQIGSALAAAHAQQVVHRDLKPSNILVDGSGPRPRYVLADFGVGRAAAGIRAEKDVGGTYLYMAPEQLRGRPGAQSDLWAAGVIAYQMLTGNLPFPGPSLQEVSRQIQYADPPPPSTVTGRALPGRLEEAVLGLLRKSLTERTASAADLLAQLGVRDPEKVEAAPPKAADRRALPVAESLRRAGRRAFTILIVTLIAYVVFNGVVSGLLLLTGLALFYHSQAHVRHRGKRALLVLAAFVVLFPRLAAAFSPAVAKLLALGSATEQVSPLIAFEGLARWTGVPAAVLFTGFLVLVLILSLLLPVIGSAAYANLRRAGRERALVDAAVAGRAGSAEFLDLMRDLVATRFEDVGFHLRYAELLYARGDHRAAAVEARLITVQDPYHFEANLLLANAYLALGLARECRRVCDDYLAVTGYCFEFQELRDQSAAGVPA